ncbi:MAG: FGGY-family carbohydrate kinase [Janthinobacterium lividum]
MSAVVVLDVGKTNVKLTVASDEGRLGESVSRPNPVRPGPPYRHHDLAAIEEWLLGSLADLARRHSIGAVVTSGHGSGGVLVDADGPVLPMMDYEQPAPPEVTRSYASAAGSFRERGSAIMLGTAHLARQMMWMEQDWPEDFGKAVACLAVPQYWAWRLSGVLASEVTSLAAQSGLWCAADARPSALVKRRGWDRLLPRLQPAWATLGPLRPEIAARTGLAKDVRVVNGIHDSSANLYRYQAAGLADMTLVSTGTWIVALSDRSGPDLDVERPGLCCNADTLGRPLPGMLTMGGREFAAVSGGATGPARADLLARLVETGTMALPSFGDDDGLFPGTAGRGELRGSMAQDPEARFTLAVLMAALQTDRCLDGLPAETIVLDGPFVREPLFGALIGALHPGRQILVNFESYGVAAGAALLASHETRTAPVPLALTPPPALHLDTLPAYRDRWRSKALSRR